MTKGIIILYLFHGTFLTCVGLLWFWQNAQYPTWIWVIIGLTFFVSLFTQKKLYIVAILFGCSLAMITVQRVQFTPRNTSIENIPLNTNVTIIGTVDSEPDRRPMHTRYVIRSNEVSADSENYHITIGKALVSDYSGWPQYFFGDELRVSGVITEPKSYDSFNYKAYLAKDSIYRVLKRPTIEKLRSNSRLSIRGTLYGMKEKFEDQINRIFPEPHASFLAGLLTGSRRGIPEKTLESFHATGLTHIIAISGYNITLVIGIVSALLLWLPLKWRLIPSIIAIVLFTMFTGASAPVIRASIMGALSILALHTNRKSIPRIILLWTATCMTLWNPYYLWVDAGFQLSFLAVIGISEGDTILKPMVKYVPRKFGIRDALHITLAAQLFAAPLIAFLFERFSLIAPIANILSAPAIPIAMLFGFIGTLISFVSFPLGQLVSVIAYISLEWILQVAKLISFIPFASIEMKYMNIYLCFIYYILLILILCVRNNGLPFVHMNSRFADSKKSIC